MVLKNNQLFICISNMKLLVTIIVFACVIFYLASCNQPRSANEQTNAYQPATDKELAEFISKISAVDNHAHPNTIDPGDKGSDALPLDGLGAIELPARVRPESETWLNAGKALYGFRGAELNEESMKGLMDTMQNAMKQKGEKFPEWVLDMAGIEVMFANRIAMGPGISPPRFRWVTYVDALLFPLYKSRSCHNPRS